MTESYRALVTGVSGQDGSILARDLISRGWEVHGLVRRHAVPRFENIQDLVDREALTLHEGDLVDQGSLLAVARDVRPEFVFNLAAMSDVGASYKQPDLTYQVTGLGPGHVFEAVRQACRRASVYHASSSEMFGQAMTTHDLKALDEESPMEPVSPYALGKLHAHKAAAYFRSVHKMHISCGILFNHESEVRGPRFVTRKITLALARMAAGSPEMLRLGNLDAIRDWGYAPEYCEMMVRMVMRDHPDDFVVATGEGHSVREFLDEAVRVSRIDEALAAERIVVDEALKRPSDIPALVGDASRARAVLNWEPKVRFRELARVMVEADKRRVAREVAA